MQDLAQLMVPVQQARAAREHEGKDFSREPAFDGFPKKNTRLAGGRMNAAATGSIRW
jgi:hypothetical protein